MMKERVDGICCPRQN